MNPVKSLVNIVRIAPHGMIPSGIAIMYAVDKTLNLGVIDSIPETYQWVPEAIVGGSAIMAAHYGTAGISNYLRFRYIIKEDGLLRRHVQENLRWYCERQAYKAAAYSCGKGKEFDEINANFQGKKYLTFIPEI
jgi:hypothetical protein